MIVFPQNSLQICLYVCLFPRCISDDSKSKVNWLKFSSVLISLVLLSGLIQRKSIILEIISDFVHKTFGPSANNDRSELNRPRNGAEISQKLVIASYDRLSLDSYSLQDNQNYLGPYRPLNYRNPSNMLTLSYSNGYNSMSYYQQQSNYDSKKIRQCFDIDYNCILVNSAGFERRTVRSVADCADFCANSARDLRITCGSFLYHQALYTCDLYTEADKGKRFSLTGYICGFATPDCLPSTEISPIRPSTTRPLTTATAATFESTRRKEIANEIS